MGQLIVRLRLVALDDTLSYSSETIVKPYHGKTDINDHRHVPIIPFNI